MEWVRRTSPDTSRSSERIAALARRPLFSVMLPTYNSRMDFFRALIASIRNQTYDHFEVCISDDGSTDAGFLEYLKALPAEDPRFRPVFSGENGGIAENTNRAMATARGEYLVLCDHDDLMEPFALESLALYLDAHPDADLVYSDEDMLTPEGVRHSPRLQPDWNPDMMTSHMYCPHMVSMKKSLADRTGRMDPVLDGAQDYDYFLRLSENARHIGHIPRVLYSWRSAPGSVAMDPSAKPYAYEAGRKALENAMGRRGEEAVVVKASGTGLGVYRVKRPVGAGEISHIVAAASDEALIAARSIRINAGRPVEVLMGVPEERDDLALAAEKEPGVRVFRTAPGSSRGQVYNQGAALTDSRFLIFSPHNVEILDGEYPGAALEHAGRPEIGAVGAKLIYPNGNLYHTGLILGVLGLRGYAHRNIFQSPGYWNFALCIRNYSAVSWDLLAVERKKWEEVGGFDEKLTDFGDVDFCLKLTGRGYRHVYTPYVSGVLMRGVHSPDELTNGEEAAVLVERYGESMLEDPFFHPLLRKDLEDFSIDL